MHLDRIAALGRLADVGAFTAELVRTAHGADFGRVAAMLVTERPGSRARFDWVGNTPEAFWCDYNDPRLGKADPVMQHIRTQVTPILYDQRTYTAAGAGALWETQAPFGYRTGIVVSLRLSETVRYACGIDRDAAIPTCPNQRARMIGDLMLMAAFTAEAAQRLLAPDGRQTGEPNLTDREREILTWTLRGKSAWVVGQLLGLAVGTVNFHLRNAMRKLGVSNKYVAASLAFRLGLICP